MVKATNVPKFFPGGGGGGICFGFSEGNIRKMIKKQLKSDRDQESGENTPMAIP